MILHGGKVLPHFVTADLDQARACSAKGETGEECCTNCTYSMAAALHAQTIQAMFIASVICVPGKAKARTNHTTRTSGNDFCQAVSCRMTALLILYLMTLSARSIGIFTAGVIMNIDQIQKVSHA